MDSGELMVRGLARVHKTVVSIDATSIGCARARNRMEGVSGKTWGDVSDSLASKTRRKKKKDPLLCTICSLLTTLCTTHGWGSPFLSVTLSAHVILDFILPGWTAARPHPQPPNQG